jgi:hypothetical protein
MALIIRAPVCVGAGAHGRFSGGTHPARSGMKGLSSERADGKRSGHDGRMAAAGCPDGLVSGTLDVDGLLLVLDMPHKSEPLGGREFEHRP